MQSGSAHCLLNGNLGGSQLGLIMPTTPPTRTDMAMPGDILVDITRGEKAKDAAKHPTMHRTASNNKELSSLKWQ